MQNSWRVQCSKDIISCQAVIEDYVLKLLVSLLHNHSLTLKVTMTLVHAGIWQSCMLLDFTKICECVQTFKRVTDNILINMHMLSIHSVNVGHLTNDVGIQYDGWIDWIGWTSS